MNLQESFPKRVLRGDESYRYIEHVPESIHPTLDFRTLARIDKCSISRYLLIFLGFKLMFRLGTSTHQNHQLMNPQ